MLLSCKSFLPIQLDILEFALQYILNVNFLLIEVRFLTVVRSAFVPSIAMISQQINSASLRKETRV
jgi:hypothetical protein